jgi:NAD(P)-dependent dehydrogenase (short-subunit alcohol dehydrogenase family)
VQVLLCEYLANQPGEQITFVSCHPGWTDTPGVEFAYGSMKLAYQCGKLKIVAFSSKAVAASPTLLKAPKSQDLIRASV